MGTGQFMLAKLIRSYIAIGLVLYLFIFFYWLDSVNYYNILNVAALLSYAYLLWACIDKDDEYFSNRRLWLTVFLYSSLFVGLYLQMSELYGGNFIQNMGDGKAYARLTNRMKDMSGIEALTYISHVWGYDDWGAPMTMAFIFKIIPSKIFLNFCYILMNSVSALWLFSIGKTLNMSKKYAYMAALTYSIASYTLFFLGSFLKEEMMCFLIIASFYYLYKYQKTQNLLYLATGGLTSFLIIFFRVPLALFVWISYASLLLSGNKGHIKRMLFLFLFVVIAVFAAGFIMYSSMRYANSGDVTSSYQYVTTSLFQKVVSAAGALTGPFPTMFQISTVELSQRPMYGAGLLFKFLLFFPFWKGLVHCVKTGTIELYPLYLFTVMEMMGLCVVVDGLEVRKSIPHIAFFVLCAFWYMDQFDRDVTADIQATPYYYWTHKGLTVSIIIVFGVSLAWNMLLRISGVQHLFLFSTDQ